MSVNCSVQSVVLPFRRILAGWRNGQSIKIWNSTNTNPRSCSCGGITPWNSTGWGLTCWEAALRTLHRNIALTKAAKDTSNSSFSSPLFSETSLWHFPWFTCGRQGWREPDVSCTNKNLTFLSRRECLTTTWPATSHSLLTIFERKWKLKCLL